MKKIIIFLCGIILLGITGCRQEMKMNEIQKEQFLLGTTLDDGRHVFSTFDVPYNENKTLLDAFLYNEFTINAFLDQLNEVETLRDGGSKLYHYNAANKEFGNEDFYVISCNSIDHIKDIYIAKQKESLNNKCSIQIDDLNGVSMQIKEGTLTKTGATVIITDTSNRKNIYGESYQLEKEENGIWVALTPINEMFFTDIGYTINKNHTLELIVNWEYHYGVLESGTYRILKGTSEAGEATIHYISAQFVIV